MPTHFRLTERVVGYALDTAEGGRQVHVCFRELIGPEDARHLLHRLENLHGSLFSKVPGLSVPSVVDHLLIVIRPDLQCTAYVNELKIIAQVRATRSVQAGEPVHVGDISDVSSLDLGVEVPDDCGVVLVRSHGWRRSLFFDFGPLGPQGGPRSYPLDKALAQQALLLLGLLPGDNHDDYPTRLQHMKDGLERLKKLLAERCEQEGRYQELLEQCPWMLGGGQYTKVMRHVAQDDRNIPDFTAVRCYDECHDIIELKQPFLQLFRQDGGYTSAFNDAWNQAERYISFAHQQRSYLREEKALRFENPRCLLVLGHSVGDRALAEIRKKEAIARSISVLTYDQLVTAASHMVALMASAQDRIMPESTTGPDGQVLKLTTRPTARVTGAKARLGKKETPSKKSGRNGRRRPTEGAKR